MCKGLAEAWLGLKYGHNKDQHAARNIIEVVVISIGDEGSMKAAAKCVGMNKHTVRRAVAQRHLFNRSAEGEVWAKNNHHRRRDALQQTIVDVVVEWWMLETRIYPSKKDIKRKRVGVRSFIEHATHWFEGSQVRGSILLFGKQLGSIFSIFVECHFH